MSDNILSKMRKWLRDLDRATVKRNRSAIVFLYDENSKNESFKWDDPGVPAELAEDYDLFVERANNVLIY